MPNGELPKKGNQKHPRTSLGEVDTNVQKPSKSSFFQLVSKKEPTEILPFVPGSKKHLVEQSIRTITHSNFSMPTDVNTTPGKNHLNPDENGFCGFSASGHKLVYSPSKHLQISITHPENGKTESIDLYLLVRQKDYKSAEKSPVYEALEDQPISAEKTLSVTASHETRSDQPPRKKSRPEAGVMGKSAKQIVVDYFKKCGVSTTEYENHQWNLCHILSYGIAMNAKDENGKTFNTQIADNLFSGTREFNENMMRVENVLLQLIKDKTVKEIEYMSLHAEFEGSDMIARLTLKANLECHNGSIISFEHTIDVSDLRRLPHAASTAYFAAIKSLIDYQGPSSENSPTKSLKF